MVLSRWWSAKLIKIKFEITIRVNKLEKYSKNFYAGYIIDFIRFIFLFKNIPALLRGIALRRRRRTSHPTQCWMGRRWKKIGKILN